ncbi:Cupredoxin [Sphaerosporella brunnea]|uniref:Cupredoxin n=1 Tax=Sphaerosporella brunnea TaxID=1250544 RepID=A0A5J5EVN2_9PEZI|nr:Cupredoxin [Sphaerosporella brunnea]
MLISPIALFAASLLWAAGVSAQQLPRRSPPYPYAFQYALPIPPTKVPIASYKNPTTGVPIDFYEVHIRPFKKGFFPGLQDADLVGYDGLFPGPVFKVERGRETLVRFVNGGHRPASVHLHGSFTRAPWDGWAEDLLLPGEFKDYYYPNQAAARTLWYHDHTAGLTTLNTYAGQVGMYLITDSAVESRLGLPQRAHDIPLLLDSHFFTAAGNISDESKEVTSTYGDTFTVNGQILPYLKVEPRKYRFRLLDAAVSRTFNLTLMDKNTSVPFVVVASDAGFRETPVETKSLVIAMAERWEIVIDFAPFVGKNLTLAHTTIFADTDYVGSDKVMQFNVGKVVTDWSNNGPIPKKLVELKLPKNSPVVERTFNFVRNIGQPWTINGKPWSDPMSRVQMKPPLGTVEKYNLRGTGGWSHPVHLHLVDMQLLSRTVGNPNQKAGRMYLEEYEKGALKDIALLGDNEQVTVLAKFVPYEGVYMFHCHNVVHEDVSMMAAFNITALQDFGYGNLTGGLEDPLDKRFKAKTYSATNLQQIKSEVLPYYAWLNAYPDPAFLEARIDEHWLTYKGPSPTSSASAAVSTSSSGTPLTRSFAQVTSDDGSRPPWSITLKAQEASITATRSFEWVTKKSKTWTPYTPSTTKTASTPDSTTTETETSTFTTTLVVTATYTTNSTSSSTTAVGPVLEYRCGAGYGNRTCEVFGDEYCCSEWGWCGVGSIWCGNGCQLGPCLKV